MLKQLLYSDLARQYEIEGRSPVRASFAGLLLRLLHHRFLPIVLCRTSRWALLHSIPLLSGLCTYLNIVLFGLEVAPRCEIGPGIFFPHTSGTVIGAWRIGSNATIFQGVTLGSRELDMGFDINLRPELGNNVVIGTGAKVLGGVRIGDNGIVGANAVVVEPVANNSTVVGVPARLVKTRARSAVAAN
jgi:serine O-acetyltransferase